MLRWITRGVATFGFVGHLPLAPGTWASAITLALWLVLPPAGIGTQIAVWLLILVVGTWTAHRLESDYGHDDQRIVIDEVSGSLLAVAGFPHVLPIALAGFVLFRLFDIVKPPPIYQIQSLPGGLGVMVDDLVAGLFANVVLRFFVMWNPGGLLGG